MKTPTFKNLASPENIWGIGQTSLDKVKVNQMRVVYDLVPIFLAAKVPITAWGPVGVGKTQRAEDLRFKQDENGTNFKVITVAAATDDPTTIHGLRYTSLDPDGTTVMNRSLPDTVKMIIDYSRTDRIVRNDESGEEIVVSATLAEPPEIPEGYTEVEIIKHGGLTVLFLDEMTTCMPAQQHALLGILTHGNFGGVDISRLITIMMAANPPGTVSTVNDLGEQVMNRGGHLPWYGDIDLWLEGWSSGFDRPERKPDMWAVELVEETLQNGNARSQAFRDESWDSNQLVPYDRIQHTPRSFDVFTKVALYIKDLFDDNLGKAEIRDFYITQAAKALMGIKWESHVALALSRIAESIKPTTLISKVRQSGLTLASEFEEFDLLDLSFMRQKLDGSFISLDQEEAIISDLIALITKGGSFSSDAYLTSWAFVLKAPDQASVAGMHKHVMKLVDLYGIGVQSGALSRERGKGLPLFMSDATREQIREARKAKSVEQDQE